MFDLDRWQEILHALGRNPLRTALTALGVFWGILMLILMIGAGNGLENGVRKDMSDRATNSFFMWARSTSMPYAGRQPGRRIKLNGDDFQAIKALIPEARYICPRNQLGGHRGSNNVFYKTKTGAFEVTGDIPDIQHVELIKLVEGRFLNPIDLEEQRKVAVIGLGVKEQLYEANEDPIGTYLRIQGSYFRVVGIFKTNQSGERAERETLRIYTPLPTFQKAFNYGNFISWFAITSQPGMPASVPEEKALALLKERHQVSPEDERAFGHFNLEEELQEVENVFFGINALSWIVGIFTLLAGAIGISNIMLVIIKERTKEIGIRRAIGAKPITIISQIITEATFLTVVAGYAGLVLGIGLLELLRAVLLNSEADLGMFGPPNIEVSLALQALAVLVITGIIAGLLPAYRAISISPVDALRSE